MANSEDYIRFDWAMKHMLRDKANFDILEGFISVLLKDDVKIEEILESESNQEESGKYNYVNEYIKAVNSEGFAIIILMRLTRKLHYLWSLHRGTCPLISKQDLENMCGAVYKVYSICIFYFDFGQGDDYIYYGDTNFKGINSGNQLILKTKEDGVIVPHLPKEVFPEYYLLRVNAFSKIPETPLDEWMEYLKTGVVKEDTLTPGLQEVKEKLRLLSMSKAERRSNDAHMDTIMVQNDVLDTAHDEGYAEGHAEGRAEGRAEGITAVTLNMISLGVPENEISNFTKLPVEEIRKLKDSI